VALAVEIVAAVALAVVQPVPKSVRLPELVPELLRREHKLRSRIP
jgi:hypothetical protein